MDKLNSIGVAGSYNFEVIRDGQVIDAWEDNNLVPTEGLAFLLNLLFDPATAKNTDWYMGLGTGAYTPTAADTGATISGVGAANETSAYTELTRPRVVLPVATSGTVSNSASKATFTANAAITLTNAFVVSTAPKGDTSGRLLSSLAITPGKTLAAGDQLVVTFTFQASSV